MVELDIIVDKWGCLKLLVVFDREEHDWTLKDCGIEVVGASEEKVILMGRDNGGDGNHVQERFEQ